MTLPPGYQFHKVKPKRLKPLKQWGWGSPEKWIWHGFCIALIAALVMGA